jgi:NADH-quinone oxidoreductase subunit E
VDDLRAERTVEPTRGAPLCTYQETARILAGFPDARPGSVQAGGSAGHASLAGLRLAKGDDTGPARVVTQRAEPLRGEQSGEQSAEYPGAHDAPMGTVACDPAHRTGPVTGDEREEGGQ